MKRIFSLLLILTAIISFSCGDDAVSPNGGGGLGGGGGNGGGGVTFTMGTTQQGTQAGGVFFTFKPSVAVTATSLTFKLPAQSFETTLTNTTPTDVFDANTEYIADPGDGSFEFTGVQSGQKWQFVFVGKLGSSTGAAYTQTVDWTVP